jgi:hypothetical protein
MLAFWATYCTPFDGDGACLIEGTVSYLLLYVATVVSIGMHVTGAWHSEVVQPIYAFLATGTWPGDRADLDAPTSS